MNDAAGRPRGPRWRARVIAAVLGVFVLIVAGLVIWNLTGGGEPTPSVTSTTTGPVPTTTVAPVPHDQTAFTQAQPGTLLDYALTAIEETEPAGDPVEAWRLAYTAPKATIDVVAAQWPDRTAAGAAFDRLLESERAEAQDVDDLGTVGAAGETVGHMWLLTAADTTVLLWQNTTAIFTLTGGPDAAEQLKAFQLAYPM